MLRLAAPVLLLLAGAAAADVPAPLLADELPLNELAVDELVIHKAARTLDLIAGGRLVRRITGIQLGREPLGRKRFEGDGRTPEGRYLIDWGNAGSAYHLSLHISYPNAADAAFAAAQGRSPGGAILLHGQPNDWTGPGRVPGDWTAGCIALTNAEIEDLWQRVGDGTPIVIAP